MSQGESFNILTPRNGSGNSCWALTAEGAAAPRISAGLWWGRLLLLSAFPSSTSLAGSEQLWLLPCRSNSPLGCLSLPAADTGFVCSAWFLCASCLCFAFCACGYVSSNFITATCQLLTSVHSFQVRLKVGIPDSSVSITWASNFSHDCDFWGLSSRLGLAKYFNYYVGVSVAISFYE